MICCVFYQKFNRSRTSQFTDGIDILEFPIWNIALYDWRLNDSNSEEPHSSRLFILVCKRSADTLCFLVAASLLPVTVSLRLVLFFVGALFMLHLPILFYPSTVSLLMAAFTSSPRLTSSNTWTPLWRTYFHEFKRPLITTGSNVLAIYLKIPPIP